jgi:hypothetical protein
MNQNEEEKKQRSDAEIAYKRFRKSWLNGCSFRDNGHKATCLSTRWEKEGDRSHLIGKLRARLSDGSTLTIDGITDVTRKGDKTILKTGGEEATIEE